MYKGHSSRNLQWALLQILFSISDLLSLIKPDCVRSISKQVTQPIFLHNSSPVYTSCAFGKESRQHALELGALAWELGALESVASAIGWLWPWDKLIHIQGEGDRIYDRLRAHLREMLPDYKVLIIVACLVQIRKMAIITVPNFLTIPLSSKPTFLHEVQPHLNQMRIHIINVSKINFFFFCICGFILSLISQGTLIECLLFMPDTVLGRGFRRGYSPQRAQNIVAITCTQNWNMV